MKRIRYLALLLVLALMFGVACSAGDGGYGFTNGAMEKPADSAEDEPSEGEDASGETPGQDDPSAYLTASALNDNEYYDFYKTLFVKGQTEEEDGVFCNFAEAKTSWNFVRDRIVADVKIGEQAVAGAVVSLVSSQGDTVFSSVTDANGRAYLFGSTEGKVRVSYGGKTYAEQDAESGELVFDLSVSDEVLSPADNVKANVIELLFLVDVTGSMGDELSYLNNTLNRIVRRIAAEDQNTDIYVALLFYRDHTDKKVFDFYDFVDVKDERAFNEQLNNISSQQATGGGDWPEAVDEALDMAVSASWKQTTSTKMIFHILDAPPHSESDNRARYYNAVVKAAAKGIRICPVVASGSMNEDDILLEYLSRQSALYTGGTYCFLTDDSGIGNVHHKPTVPVQLTVEKLDSLIIRLINGYHTGTFADPVDWRQDN